MAQIPMQKVRLAVTRDESRKLFALLHDFANFELIETSDETLTRAELAEFEHRHTSAKLDTAVNFLKKYFKGDFFRGMFEGSREHTTLSEISTLATSYDTESVIKKIQHIEGELNNVEVELKKLQEEEQLLTSWQRLRFPLNEISETKNVFMLPVRGSLRNITAFLGAFNENPYIHFEEISETTYVVVALHSERAQVEEKARDNDLELVRLPRTNSTAEKELERIANEKTHYTTLQSELHAQATHVASAELPSLKKVSDHAFWNMQQEDYAGTRAETVFTTIIDGWVPSNKFTQLTQILDKAMPSVAYENLAISEDEVPPIEIKNTGFFNSYEMITKLYGVPSHKDIDPTPFISIFFFIFFGLCLSDFGYGVILMILTGTVLVKYRVTHGMRQLLTTLFFGGLGAAIVGVIFGGYLGVAAQDINPALAGVQLFDPINDPLPVFYLSLVFGFLHVSFGIILDIVRSIKMKDTVNGILNNVPWLLMFLTLVAMIIAQINLFPAGINSVVTALWGNVALAIAALIMVTQGRKGTSIFSKITTGVLSLYNGVGYFADILSYSRLLALGLATSALGFSINLIAGFVGGESLGIGTIFMIIILILGHTLNIVLSSLGAFINSARLQFVEFFSKFLTGTGRAFKAFRREERNVILLPESPP